MLPSLGVCALVLGLTLALFDVPGRPPVTVRTALAASSAIAEVAVTRMAPGPAASPEETLERLPRDTPLVRDRLSEVLGQAMRQIGPRKRLPTTGQPGFGGGALVTGGASPPAEAPPDPGLLGAVTALGDAVKAIHEARSDEDLVHAEESVRGAREKMEAACQAGGTGAPLCVGAAQIRSLGY